MLLVSNLKLIFEPLRFAQQFSVGLMKVLLYGSKKYTNNNKLDFVMDSDTITKDGNCFQPK
jgi:hypothetical protein